MSSPSTPVKPVDPFFAKLDTKNYFYDPNTLTAADQGIISQFGSEANYDTFLAAFGTNISNPKNRVVFPRTYADFVALVAKISGNTDTTAFVQGFEAEYVQILGITGGLSGGGGDYAGVDPSTLTAQFQEAFTSFLWNFQFQVNKNPDGTPGPTDGQAGPTSYFLEQWHRWMTITAVNQASFATGPTENVSIFQQIFQAFFPNGSESDFITMRNKLMEQMRADPDFSYFLPSHFIAQWYSMVQTAYLTPLLGASTVDLTHSAKMTIIWKVFQLTVSMIASLQKLSTVIAGRLNFLTNYQKAYTDLMAQIPVFTKNDGSPFGGTDDASAQARQDLNPKNQTLTQNLQSYRDLLGDQAKQIQTNLNQLNEAVNQQSSLADSILQEMDTILQGIFR